MNGTLRLSTLLASVDKKYAEMKIFHNHEKIYKN